MQLNPIIEQVIKKFQWPNNYAKDVATEYSRFLTLRSNNNNLSPSDDIDKFWHQHILNTKHYYDYCFNHHTKIIHHNPTDSYDQASRQIRLNNTMNAYIIKFKTFVNKNVWIPNQSVSFDNTWTSNHPLNKLVIKIIYTFDTINKDGKFDGKKWRPNNNYYDKKEITYNYALNETIADLLQVVADKTKHLKLAINFYVYNKGKEQKLSNDTKLSSITNKILCVLEEATHNGFC